MTRFGAKLALALHYEFTGNIVPLSGGVLVRWFSNHDAIAGGIPPSLFDVLREPMTLRQGTWSVPEQFLWYGAATPLVIQGCTLQDSDTRSASRCS